jgi:tyrosinase
MTFTYPPRVRKSFQEIVQAYDNGNESDKATLNNLIRAFRKIQNLPPDHPDSFFHIASYYNKSFNQHKTVLFPTWHRAYVYRMENALRNQMPEADISLPFWDECATRGTFNNPIPWPFTQPTFELDGSDVNPFYSYKLAKGVVDMDDNGHHFHKNKGYETVRHPLSGSVGNEKDRSETMFHNAYFLDLYNSFQTRLLSNNVKEWLDGTVRIIPGGDAKIKVPDTYSVSSQYLSCLDAPNYTVFSNNVSANQWIKEMAFRVRTAERSYIVALESPSNAVGLAFGGFAQKGAHNPNPIRGASGDMGETETAAFDPLFFFHHCFVDYTFWMWQVRQNKTQTGALKIISKTRDGQRYPGTRSQGNRNKSLSMKTPLLPFTNDKDGQYLTSVDVVDIESQLGYTYGTGSLTKPTPKTPNTALIRKYARVSNVSRVDHSGSFVIRTSIELPDGSWGEIGRHPVLSRWTVSGCGRCGTCQHKYDEEIIVPVDDKTLAWVKGDKDTLDVNLKVEIQSRQGDGSTAPNPNLPEPVIEWL